MTDFSRVYHEDEADLKHLDGRTVGILGYGAQGRAHALNVRDSGIEVVVAQRPGGPNFELAIKDGFQPVSIEDATKQADVVNVLLPDEMHGPLFRDCILPNLKPDAVLMACHGFSLHYKQMVPPDGVASLLVAPKGAGHMVRSAFVDGHGVACLIAMGDNATDATWDLGMAYAKALGGTRAGVIETTIAAETETDLFGEQVVLCGGVSHLVKSAFDTLVEAGYQKELAFFECMHELKLVVDLLHRGGLAFMHEHISNTAEYGDFSRGERIVNEASRQEMKKILSEIQSGQFAREWLEEYESGASNLNSDRDKEKSLDIEKVGNHLRELMAPKTKGIQPS